MAKGHPSWGWAPIGFAVAAPWTNLPQGIVLGIVVWWTLIGFAVMTTPRPFQWNNMIPDIPSYPLINSYVHPLYCSLVVCPCLQTPNTHLTGRHASLQWLTGHTTALDLSNSTVTGWFLIGRLYPLPSDHLGENPKISFSKVMVFCIFSTICCKSTHWKRE